MKRINIQDIDLNSLEVILDKAGRWIDGVNHGRKVLRDKDSFYKVFDKEYCRLQNFIDAYESGFFDGLAPALKSLIVDGDDIIGYITERGELLSTTPLSKSDLKDLFSSYKKYKNNPKKINDVYYENENYFLAGDFTINTMPKEFYKKIIDTTIIKEMFFYDLHPVNVIKTKDGKISLIDLESVYPIEELHTIRYRHNAKVKPDTFYFEDLKTIWKENMKPISFIQPSRNNLKYLKWSYESIRKNLSPIHEICWADDYSDDGTWEWMQEIADKDPNVKIHRNEGPNRLGHTILYDTLVNDYATNDIVMIYHADMYACPGMDEQVLKHLIPGTVVSATRIEPPLHPDGPEKVLKDFGIEPEEFKESELMKFIDEYKPPQKSSKGIFAPWAIYKKDFQEINGHDPLYAPQSKEDSDIFNRFVLAGYELIQTWKGFVYHMTCRGSRFKDGALRNPAGQVFMKNRESSEWLTQNKRSTRNFIRKWGHMVKHDEMMHPVVPPKYDVGFVVRNCDYNLLTELEPWCSTIYIEYTGVIESYIKQEQKDTEFNLTEKIKHYPKNKPDNNIIIEFEGKMLNSSNFQILVELSSILKESGEVGEMELEIFKFNINSLQTYEKELIKV